MESSSMTKYVSWLRCRNGDFDRFVCVPFPAEHDLYLVIEEICMFLLHGSGLFSRRLSNQIQRIHTEVYHPVNQDSWLYILLELELHYTLLYSIIHGIQPHFHLEFASDCYVGMFFSPDISRVKGSIDFVHHPTITIHQSFTQIAVI